MSNSNVNKLVPKLRFPEFTNEIWKRKTIDETCEVLNNLRKPLTSNLREKGEYPYYGASGIIDFVKNFIFNERLLLIGEDGAKWGAYEKTAFIADGKYWVNNHAHVLKPTGVVDTLLENYLVKLDLSPFITGAAPPKLTLGKLKSIPVPIPNSRKEQQKIAACLSSLDEVIIAESQKLEVLKEHKKGLLQNLFPQAGETVPKFRFKEFEDSGEWVEKELGSFCNSLSSGKDKNIEDGEYELYGSTGIIGRAENPSYEGDYILVARVGANAGFLNKVAGKFGVTDNTLVIDLIKKEIINFIYYSLQNVGLKELVFGSGQPLITGGQLKSLQVQIPPNEKEQEKIADTLSSVDDLIIAQNQKLEALQLHKKGLLQGLFPNVNEVTA
jgi:type I restriction enzyme S subunit